MIKLSPRYFFGHIGDDWHIFSLHPNHNGSLCHKNDPPVHVIHVYYTLNSDDLCPACVERAKRMGVLEDDDEPK